MTDRKTNLPKGVGRSALGADD